MTHVITQPCIGTKSADCVEVCPVNCIHDGGELYYIDPVECIDCGACVATCPVEAIFAEPNVPDEWKSFTQKNAELAKKGPQANGGQTAPKAEKPAAPPAAKQAAGDGQQATAQETAPPTPSEGPSAAKKGPWTPNVPAVGQPAAQTTAAPKPAAGTTSPAKPAARQGTEAVSGDGGVKEALEAAAKALEAAAKAVQSAAQQLSGGKGK